MHKRRYLEKNIRLCSSSWKDVPIFHGGMQNHERKNLEPRTVPGTNKDKKYSLTKE